MILRPSPYICGEWDWGGLPAWLMRGDEVKIRCSDPQYQYYVRRYYQKLMPILVPFQCDHGGPVIMMQVENEYGSYGNDREYIAWLRDLMRQLGVTIPLVSSDGPEDDMLKNSATAGVFPTANFGSDPVQAFSVLKKYNRQKALMCMEFWEGWFDAWGHPRNLPSPDQHLEPLEQILDAGSVNIYLAEGGTNFGFMNGSNYYECPYHDVTSYDYDALLTEDGMITEKYKKFREIIMKYVPEERKRECRTPDSFAPRNAAEYGKIEWQRRAGLFRNLPALSRPIRTVNPESMERLGQNFGYIYYQARLDTEDHLTSLQLYDAADRAILYLDQKRIAEASDQELSREIPVKPVECLNRMLGILMENCGRVNYGAAMIHQRKGIDGGVQINHRFMQYHWETFCLPMNNLEQLSFEDPEDQIAEDEPCFYLFEFFTEDPRDTFLDFSGWGRGFVTVNGFNIGRFRREGPQKRLYIPGPVLRKGKNQIILFETEGITEKSIRLCSEPDLG